MSVVHLLHGTHQVRDEVERLEREGHDAVERILQTMAHARRHMTLAQLPVSATRMARAATLSTSTLREVVR